MPPLRAVARRQLLVAPPVAPQLPSSLAFVSNPLGRPHTSPGRGGVPPTPQIKMRGGVFPYTGKDCTQAGEIIIASGPSTNKTTDRRSPAPDVPSVDPPVPPPRLSFGRTPPRATPLVSAVSLHYRLGVLRSLGLVCNCPRTPSGLLYWHHRPDLSSICESTSNRPHILPAGLPLLTPVARSPRSP